MAGQIPSLEYFQGEFEKIFPEQIRSAWEVIVSLIMGEKQEHVTGLTQLGKNGLITVLLDFLGVVAGAYEVVENKNEDPKILIPVAWLPNAINMEKQSIEKLRLTNFKVIDKGVKSMAATILNMSKGTQLWKWCVIFALLCLGLEIALIRWMKG